MPFLELFDETLDINSTENYELSVQIGFDELCLCILDTLRNKFVLIRSYEPESFNMLNAGAISDIVEKDDFLNRRYKKIYLIIPSQKSTLIPSPLFEESAKEDYFRFNHILENDEIVLKNKLIDPDAYILFSAPLSIVEVCGKFFRNVEPLHHLKPLLLSAAGGRRSQEGNYIQVHLEKNFFNIIIYDQITLKFCNTFKYKTLSDLQYYIFYTLKRLNINQEEVIHFSGRTDKHDNMVNDFSRYARNIRFAEPSGNFTFSYVFNEILQHKYFNLFSVINCE